MRKLLFALSLLLTTLSATAIPAKHGQWRTITLTDGTEVNVKLQGDEYAHFWQDAKGNSYVFDETQNAYKVANMQQLMEKAQARRAAANSRRSQRLKGQKKVGEFGNFIGSKKGLIILVQYKDVSFKAAHTQAYFNRVANEENFSHADGFIGSVHDYFTAQSGGQFDLTFDVMGPVTLSQNQSYYGGNDWSGNDKNPEKMVIEGCQAIDSQVDFHDYDWDGDGEVDQVFILYAGLGEANGGSTNTVWPHEWELSSAGSSLTLDGVKIDTYGCSCELQPSGVDGIGTICHEFSHCLGYPDMYDTAYGGHYGMYSWDLMDMGSYNGDGFIPAGYTSYEKMCAGWQQPIELKGTKEITGMKALTEEGESYIIYNKAHTDEYFLLENRQKNGWDQELEGNGLLILHLDYNANIWANNMVNTTSSGYGVSNNHERCTIFKADNKDNPDYNGYRTASDVAGDPYPYGSNNKLTNTSSPAAKLYNNNTDGKKYMNVEITNITRNSDGTISFKFSDGTDDELDQKVEQTLDLVELPAMTYGDEDYQLPETTNEGLPLTWTSNSVDVATIENNAIHIKKAGTTTITAKQNGNDSYEAFSKSFTLTVAKARLTITAEDKTMVEGDDLPELTYTISGFKYDDDITVLNQLPTVQTSATSESEPGTYPIRVSGARSVSYSMSYVGGTLTITARNDHPEPELKDQTLALEELPVMTYGDEGYSLPAETEEGLPLIWTVEDEEVAVVEDNVLVIRGTGTTLVTAIQEGDDEYNSFDAEFTLTIEKALLTITADSYEMTQGNDLPELTVSYEGFVYDEDETVLLTLPSVYTSANSDSQPGEYDIMASGAEAKNYEISYVNGTLTIKEVIIDPNQDPDELLEFAAIGTGRFTEYFILSMGEDEEGNPLEPVTYDVEMEECTTIPGIYRLLNPYGPGFPYFSEEAWDDSRSYHLIIHAEDPDGVYIRKQAIGIDDEYGIVCLQTWGSYFMENYRVPFDDLKSSGNMGKVREGVITFPSVGVVVSFADGSVKETVNKGGLASIELPKQTPETPTNVKSLNTQPTAKHGVYDLQGRRITGNRGADMLRGKGHWQKGVYIVDGKKVVY